MAWDALLLRLVQFKGSSKEAARIGLFLQKFAKSMYFYSELLQMELGRTGGTIIK